MHQRGKYVLLQLIFILALLAWPLQAAAQMAIGRIQITEIDYKQFPDVTVQAIIRDGNANPIPESDLKDIELLEDRAIIDLNNLRAERVTSGVEVMFVLDMGMGILSPGLTLTPSGLTHYNRMEEMQNIVRSYLGTMQPDDYGGLITIQPEQDPSVRYLQSLTSDEQVILKSIDALVADPKTPSNPFDGINQAITELSSSQGHKGSLEQAIIYLSSGQLRDADAIRLADRATKANITIHAVRISNQRDATGLRKLAEASQGVYAEYRGDSNLKDLFAWIENQRVQYRFSYRSTSNSSEPREIVLRSKGVGIGQIIATDNYQVALKPPVVEIVTPVMDREFIRQATSPDDKMDLVEPTETNIQARVSWPDDYPRKLKQVQLWIDGSIYGPAVTDIPNQSNILFTWDLSSYTTTGTTLPQIQVQAEDELLLSSTSNPVIVKITVIIPEIPETLIPNGTPTPTPSPKCEGLEGPSLIQCKGGEVLSQVSWVNWLTLGIAMLALAFVVIFRGRVSGAAVQVGDAVRQTIARITRPPQTEVGAYLNVLRGADDLPRNQFPIYVNTVTPIGRDKRQAELVFDEDAERSVVSRIHCEISENGGRFTIRDLGSNHGTYVNGAKLQELSICELHHGDQIELGPVERGGILLGFELAQPSQPYAYAPNDLPDRKTEPVDFES